MTIDQSTTEIWGAPDPTAARWGLRETVTAIGVAALIAAFGGTAIYAATGSAHTGQQAAGHGGPGAPPQPPGGPGDRQSAPPDNLHGEFVVSNGTDGYITRLIQTGAVTDISPTAITVRSADNFTQTYTLPPGAGTDRSIAKNDEVSIQATRTGQIVTVNTISERMEPGDPVKPPDSAPS